MTADELFFFNGKESALPLYAAFRSSVLDNLPDTRIEAKKTQISFFNRHLFAAVSFTPVRKAKDRSDPFLTITFGLPYRKESPRIDAAVEPYPHRWTSCFHGSRRRRLLAEANSDHHKNLKQGGTFVAQRRYEYDGMIHEVPDSGGAYVLFPWNIREEFGKGRVKVHAEFDGIPYDGSIVNMGVKDEDGNVCYIIGLLKSIRNQLGKGDRDSVHVVIQERG